MYAYAANNPVRYIDPDGKSPTEDELAKSLGKTSEQEGVDLNLFPAEHEKDIIVKTETGEKIYMRDAANEACRYTSMYYVGAHGSRGSVLFFGIDGKQALVRLKPAQLATLIKSDKKYHNQPVVLWICDTGQDPDNKKFSADCFAQQLADCLGENSKVIASEGLCAYNSYMNEYMKQDGTILRYRTFEIDPGNQHIFIGRKNEK